MAIDTIGHGRDLGGRRERGGTLKLLIPVVLMVDGLLLLLVGRGGGNLPGSGRRTRVGQDSRGRRWRNLRLPQEGVGEASPAVGTPDPTPAPVSVVEQLACFRDIGTWLSLGLAEGGALPGAIR